MIRLTEREARALRKNPANAAEILTKKTRTNKMNIGSAEKRTDLHGVVHASGAQMERWLFLTAEQDAGRIRHLDREKEYKLVVNGRRVGIYRADHVYEEKTEAGWVPIVEDVKGRKAGTEYNLFRLKAAIMETMGFPIRVVQKGKRGIWLVSDPGRRR